MTWACKRVIIDIDDTLSNLREEVMVEFNAMTGKNRHWSDWEVLKVEQLYGVDDFLGPAYKSKLLERSRPHAETLEFMTRLALTGVEINILTAREWHPRAYDITTSWLHLYGIPYDHVMVCGLSDCKAAYIQKMKDVLFTIDDSKSHCNNYAAMSKNRPEFVFAYAMPWNTGVNDGVIRIDNLNDVFTHIEGL